MANEYIKLKKSALSQIYCPSQFFNGKILFWRSNSKQSILPRRRGWIEQRSDLKNGWAAKRRLSHCGCSPSFCPTQQFRCSAVLLLCRFAAQPLCGSAGIGETSRFAAQLFVESDLCSIQPRSVVNRSDGCELFVIQNKQFQVKSIRNGVFCIWDGRRWTRTEIRDFGALKILKTPKIVLYHKMHINLQVLCNICTKKRQKWNITTPISNMSWKNRGSKISWHYPFKTGKKSICPLPPTPLAHTHSVIYIKETI